ncbi:phosphatidate cytidylyltransferase [Dysosmobacter sp.]|uniref:phosphatidate cytidylyltransferase n=1 Tax=Dysosmobacter sp. TaxID=2591382 RepID=UPI002A8CE09E|nr:phosphatidate cytidylyltransferase [Dysosmobacter sp.]MDY3282861.1 phosphatidate cytidylyltransferase [Dysosmobacter sp.]
MTSFQSRVLVSVIGVPLLAWVVLWAPPVVLLIALCLLAGIGAIELQQCVSGAKRSVMISMSTVCAMLVVGWYYGCPEQVSLLFLLETLVFFGYAIVKAGAVKFDQIMAGLFGSIAIGYSFSAFLRLEASGLHRAYLLLPFILSFACDTFAYLVGCSIGKHKLAPKVSPKKSVEGAVGGLLGNVLCGLLFAVVMDRWFGGSIGCGPMVVLALACGVVAQIGDLSFSLIKREFGIKDYGHLFLAHGGVLDRFDSVLFVTPVLEIILNFVR